MFLRKLTDFLVLIFIALFVFEGCTFFSTTNQYDPKQYIIGGLTGNDWDGINPYAMVLIPEASVTVGNSDQDIPFTQVAQPKTVTFSAFYIDETEITNAHYKKFIQWVKDSIAHRTIDGEHVIPDPTGETFGSIDWSQSIDWSNNPESEDYALLEELMLGPDERMNQGRVVDIRKLKFRYVYIDYLKAAKTRAQYSTQYRGDLYEVVEVPIYPDTLVWLREFTYSYNDPIMLYYFNSPKYEDYPVVGVTWPQARAFSVWRTERYKEYLVQQEGSSGAKRITNFRLPTEYEWEYAASGGLQRPLYPWGGPYIRNNKGCFLANFKPMRGRYEKDGFSYTSKAASFNPNQFGVYDMAGNVAEWTVSAYDESSNAFIDDFNPNYQYNAAPNDPPVMKRKVIRGGSWRDLGFFLQIGTRSYQYQDSVSSTIGFRCVASALGGGSGHLAYY